MPECQEVGLLGFLRVGRVLPTDACRQVGRDLAGIGSQIAFTALAVRHLKVVTAPKLPRSGRPRAVAQLAIPLIGGARRLRAGKNGDRPHFEKRSCCGEFHLPQVPGGSHPSQEPCHFRRSPVQSSNQPIGLGHF